jgi:hypothetical protein
MKINGAKRKLYGKNSFPDISTEQFDNLKTLDVYNTILFIGNNDNSTFNLLCKIKLCINLLFDYHTFIQLIKHSITNSELGKRYILGNSSLHNYIVTSVISNSNEEESYIVVLKHIQKIQSLQNEPGNINNIILKKFKINELYWENKLEISYMNINGKKYNMKISFFNRN